MQVVAEGHLNAIAFWFDLHLDDQVSITSAPAGFGIGGVAVDPNLNPNPAANQGQGEVSEDNRRGGLTEDSETAAAFASAVCASASAAAAAPDTTPPHSSSGGSVVMVASQSTRMAQPSAGTADIQVTATPPAAASAADGQAACVAHTAAASTAEALAAVSAAAHAPHTPQAGTARLSSRLQVFTPEQAPDALGEPAASCVAPVRLGQETLVGPAPCAEGGAADPAGLMQVAEVARAPCAGAGDASAAGGAAKGREAEEGGGEKESSGSAGPHYWGQALQYLDCSTPVAPGVSRLLGFKSCRVTKVVGEIFCVDFQAPGPEGGLQAAGSKVMVLARCEGGKVSFRLREGVGARVPRAPLIPIPSLLLHAGSKVMVLARREGGKVSFRLREGGGERVPRAPLNPKP